MPTYNCAPFLAESIGSILAQTLDDHELIIVDDGSTDDSQSILNQSQSMDDRVRVLRQNNLGAGAALNTALDAARGKYLARMDADDRTQPRRFAEEVQFLEGHPDITVVGGWHCTFGAGESRVQEFPTDPNHVKAAMLFRNPISHPTVMMRRRAFEENHWRYRTRRNFPEDYDLWITIAERHELANIPKVYLDYRIPEAAITQSSRRHWPAEVIGIQCRLLARIDLIPNDRERAIHTALAFDEIQPKPAFIAEAHAWLMKILQHNQKKSTLEERGLVRVLTGRYIALVRAAARCRAVVDGLTESPFRSHVTIPLP